MPNWGEVQSEIHSAGSPFDIKRREWVKELADYSERNVIIYYSGWLEKEQYLRQGLTGAEVNDSDKNAFMATIHGMDRTKGLDLVLHTPGGNVAATEAIVRYLHSMFDNIRVIVPHMAMSAGTMIALSAHSIVMGKHSNLGPIDPQVNGVAAHGIVEEFDSARTQVRDDPASISLWQPIIAKYPPTFVGECQKAIEWANGIVKTWLINGMFKESSDAAEQAERVVSELASHALTLSHDRHIGMDRLTALGLNIIALEDDQQLQEKTLTVHHAATQTLAATPAFKIIENQMGVSYITSVNPQSS